MAAAAPFRALALGIAVAQIERLPRAGVVSAAGGLIFEEAVASGFPEATVAIAAAGSSAAAG